MPRQKTCIFCGAAPTTKEHLFPEWFDRAEWKGLAPGVVQSRYWGASTESRTEHSQKQGRVSSETFSVACKTCNNGWMSRVEEEASIAFKGMFADPNFSLSTQLQESLARWAYMKHIVLSYDEPNHVFTAPADRTAFMATRSIKEDYELHLGRIENNEWSPGYGLRTGMLLRLDEMEVDGKGQYSISSFSIALNDVFLFSCFSQSGPDIFTLEDNFKPFLARVYPSPMDGLIRTCPIITDHVADLITNTLPRRIASLS
ncbi:hypothetical protein FHR71_005420 [Methylobacterium sp. RAS18]|nr:hypothetical protein [Methylobacterium sp. RAS18]